MDILSCKCGAYLTEDMLYYVVDKQQSLYFPEEGHLICPQCGCDGDDLEELDADDVVKLLNSK